MRSTWLVFALLTAAALGLSAAAFFAWRHVEVERVEPEAAVRTIEGVLQRLGSRVPVFRLDAHGQVARDPAAPEPHPSALTGVRVLVYRSRDGQLLRGDVPFWFLKLKGPAAQVALRGTGIDLRAMGLTPRQLERQGPGLVLDQRHADGSRTLIWTE